MKPVFCILVVFSLWPTSDLSAQSKPAVSSKIKKWNAYLQIDSSHQLPFFIEAIQSKKETAFYILNATERIKMEVMGLGDSIALQFPLYPSRIICKINLAGNMSGYWQNDNKGTNYRIPFRAKPGQNNRFAKTQGVSSTLNVSGRWATLFETNTDSPYPAVGIFTQRGDSISGTFLTETGDYRFLEGNCTRDSIYLSCFDGAHAFLFKAGLQKDTLRGKFYSGKHWSCDWKAFKNAGATLQSPDKLTYLKEGAAFTFSLSDLNNKPFQFPNPSYQNKVVIIQIMGTWCPNCIDETRYYKKLYKKYHKRGLEIIAIGYEASKTFEAQAKSLNHLKNKLDLPYQFIVGGNASKDLASEHFSMLNKIISFPTSIYIGRDGKVKRVHTGFNGPGTGASYDQFVEQTDQLIESLLKH